MLAKGGPGPTVLPFRVLLVGAGLTAGQTGLLPGGTTDRASAAPQVSVRRLPTVRSSGPGRRKEGRQLTSLKDIQVELLVLSWRAGLFSALTEQCVPVGFCSQSCVFSLSTW